MCEICWVWFRMNGHDKCRQTSYWRDWEPEATLNSEKNFKGTSHSHVTRNSNQSQEGFPINTSRKANQQQPEVSIELNWKQVNQTNIYCCWKLVNWSVCSKDSKVSACDLPQLKLRDSKRVLALNFLQTTKLLTCVCVCVCVCVYVFKFSPCIVK